MADVHFLDRGRERVFQQVGLRALAASLMCWSGAIGASEPTVEICATDLPPYQGEALPGGGAMAQLAVDAFRRGGFRANVQFMPWARVLRQGSMGQCAILGIWRNTDRDRLFDYSPPLVRHELGFFGRQNVNLHGGGADELRGLRIGVERGTYLTPSLSTPDMLLDTASSLRLSLLKLEKGRVDLVFGDRSAGLFLIESEPILRTALEWKSPGLESKNDYLALAKTAPQKDSLMEAFNRGLQAMVADGSYGSLLRAAGLDAAR